MLKPRIVIVKPRINIYSTLVHSRERETLYLFIRKYMEYGLKDKILDIMKKNGISIRVTSVSA